MRPGARFALALLPWLAACGGSPDGAGVGAAARDSAGIAVVDNPLPPETTWRLGAALPLESGPEAGPKRVVSAGDRILLTGEGEDGGVAVLTADGQPVFRTGGAYAWAAPYRGDSVAAFDPAARTIRVLGPGGAPAREVAVPTWRREGAYGVPGYAAGAVGPLDDGGFLAYATGAIDRSATEGPEWYRHHLLRLGPGGERTDTLGVLEIFQTWLGPNGPEPFPFGPVSFRAPYEDGFVFARGDAPEYRVHSADGSLDRIIRWGEAPAPVNAADLETYRTWYLERARRSGALDAESEARLSERLVGPLHPELRPALSNLLVDDEGNVWVEAFRWVDPAEVPPEPRPATWNVFGPEGRWIARLEVPAGFLLTDVADGRLYGVLVAEDGSRAARAYPLEP